MENYYCLPFCGRALVMQLGIELFLLTTVTQLTWSQRFTTSLSCYVWQDHSNMLVFITIIIIIEIPDSSPKLIFSRTSSALSVLTDRYIFYFLILNASENWDSLFFPMFSSHIGKHTDTHIGYTQTLIFNPLMLLFDFLIFPIGAQSCVSKPDIILGKASSEFNKKDITCAL